MGTDRTVLSVMIRDIRGQIFRLPKTSYLHLLCEEVLVIERSDSQTSGLAYT